MLSLPNYRFPAAGFALILAGASAFGQQPEVSTELHWGPPPRQALATIADDGKLTVKFAGSPCAVEDPKTRVMTLKTILDSQKYVADHYKAYDVSGNQIPANRLRRELKKETLVLVAPSNERVDPMHLRIYRKDVIVLVITLPPPVPGALIPAPMVPPNSGYAP